MIYNKDYIKHRTVINTTTGCWEWRLSKNPAGYGHVKADSGQTLAHRLSWVIFFGIIPNWHNVCHKCDNPSCCNPEHLFVALQGENLADMVEKGRHYNDITAALAARRIPENVAQCIIDDALLGFKTGDNASRNGVSVDTVRRTLKRHNIKQS